MSEQEDPQAETVKIAGHSVINRRSRWVSSLAALRYVNSIQKNNIVKVRDTDKVTTISLVLCCVATLVCLIVPQLERHRVSFVLAADIFVGISLLTYVANRFGILTTFQPRQALLTWQLMLGTSLLGIFFTINLALLISWMISQNQIIILPLGQ
ncbi:MAG: hypothetical protein K2W82_10335 [Candidatus Obscuribacterales bacterium]|nr:hypothetical protein [Candidatus Obscuribacterales bacterium]